MYHGIYSEPYQGKYDFSGIKDIETFLKLAEELELFVILRASLIYASEWEMGGLPAWLVKISSYSFTN